MPNNGDPLPETRDHPDCCEAYTQELTKVYGRLKELQEHNTARMDEVMKKLEAIQKEIGLQGGVVQGLSKGLANLTSPSQLKPVDDSNLGFPKHGKPESWQSATSKETGDTYYWTSDPATVKIIAELGKQAPQGYKIYPDKPNIAYYFPPKKRC